MDIKVLTPLLCEKRKKKVGYTHVPYTMLVGCSLQMREMSSDADKAIPREDTKRHDSHKLRYERSFALEDSTSPNIPIALVALPPRRVNVAVIMTSLPHTAPSLSSPATHTVDSLRMRTYRHPRASDVHTPIDPRTRSKWNVYTSAAAANAVFVSRVFVVGVAQSREVVCESTSGRSNGVVFRRRCWQRWGCLIVLESRWIERRGPEQMNRTIHLVRMICRPANMGCLWTSKSRRGYPNIWRRRISRGIESAEGW